MRSATRTQDAADGSEQSFQGEANRSSEQPVDVTTPDDPETNPDGVPIRNRRDFEWRRPLQAFFMATPIDRGSRIDG